MRYFLIVISVVALLGNFDLIDSNIFVVDVCLAMCAGYTLQEGLFNKDLQ